MEVSVREIVGELRQRYYDKVKPFILPNTLRSCLRDKALSWMNLS